MQPRPRSPRCALRRLGLALLLWGLALCAAGAAFAAEAATSPARDASDTDGSEAPSFGRRVLRAPDSFLGLLAHPLQKGVNWAERVNLPERLNDVLYFNHERTAGWFPNVSVGGQIEDGLGFQLFHNSLFGAGEEILVSTLFSISDPDERSIDFRYFDPQIGDSRLRLLAEVAYLDDADNEYFLAVAPDGSAGVGTEDDGLAAATATVRGHFCLALEVRRGLWAGLELRPLYGDVGEGSGDEPPIPSDVDGFGGPTLLLGGGPSFEWDSRDSRVRPRSGWYALVDGGYWSAVEGETTQGAPYRYARYRFDFRRYQPTFRKDRTIVLRAFLDRVETADGAVPFWDLPKLDEDRFLRGFERNRFVAKGVLLVNAEYRYPIWDTWDAFVFADYGQAFDEYRDLDIGDFEWSAGAGVNFLTGSGFLMQLRVAVSEEDVRLRINLLEPL